VSFHTNVMTVVVRPSSLGAGNPPSYTLEPLPDSRATWIEMENDATTSARQRSAISVFRPTPANRFRLAGRVGLGSPAAADVAIHEPPTFAANLLATYLSARGIRVGRGNEPSDAVRLAREDERFDGAREIARVTTSMANVLRRTNADSQNLYAESLFKLIAHESTGAPGSFAGGAAVVRMLLNGRLGASHAAATRIAEGSGLSRENLVSADTMAQWLAVVARDEAAGPAMFASLPSVGEGTLRSRFRDRRPQNAVLAKSGTIRGVRCLSGYVIGARGHTSVAFSILCNDLNDGRSIEAALRFHEDTVLAIDEWVTAQEKDALGRVGG
ncbi:MAG: D-alanyl-D-alanine carboxypeptidase, partial [Planctomycetota bacterium]